MRKNISNKKILFSTSIIVVVFLLSFLIKTTYTSSFKIENPIPTYGVQTLDNQDMSDKQEKEPVYMSIFKLIVNCNPFKQKKAVQ
ncbi:MAG TPA: hypothetical protein VK835_10840 [Bacteroidia bacterium]|nr:hypothetical protein [Bacteroidia bacterium]